jgi:DedD protein
MRENTRSSKERFEMSFDARQGVAVLVASLVVVAGVFVLGMGAGRALAGRAVTAAPKDALARLDEPLAATGEPPPELKAHEALTADKALPVQAVKAPLRRDEASPVAEVSAPPQIPADATVAPSATPAPASPSQSREPAPGRDRGQASTSNTSSPLPGPLPASGERETKVAAVSTSSREARASAAEKKTAPHRGAFTIQVASAPRRADAERVANKLAQRGARVVAADVPGRGRWYRVQIGDYPSREAASRQLASLSRAGVHGLVTAMR